MKHLTTSVLRELQARREYDKATSDQLKQTINSYYVMESFTLVLSLLLPIVLIVFI